MTIPLRCALCETTDVRDLAKLRDSSYFACPVCQLIFLHPAHRLPPDEERARYEEHENSPEDKKYRAFLAPLVEALLEQLPSGSNGLDFGSGPGPAIPAMFRQEGHEVSTYDPFFSPDRSTLDRMYEFVVCSETIEHLFRPYEELRTLNAVLKDGGWLGIMTQFFDDPGTFPHSHYARDPTHVCFYGRSTFEWIGRCLGWSPLFPRKNVALFQKGRSTSPARRDV